MMFERPFFVFLVLAILYLLYAHSNDIEGFFSEIISGASKSSVKGLKNSPEFSALTISSDLNGKSSETGAENAASRASEVTKAVDVKTPLVAAPVAPLVISPEVTHTQPQGTQVQQPREDSFFGFIYSLVPSTFNLATSFVHFVATTMVKVLWDIILPVVRIIFFLVLLFFAVEYYFDVNLRGLFHGFTHNLGEASAVISSFSNTCINTLLDVAVKSYTNNSA